MLNLKEAFENLQSKPFPDHPDCDGLDDWMLELDETDSYLAGLALSALGGGHLENIRKNDLDVLAERLETIHVLSSDDMMIYRQCQEYLRAMKAVLNALRRVQK